MLIRQEKTIEAPSAEWRIFKEYFTDGPNEQIFLKSKVEPVHVEADGLVIGNMKVVAYTDIKRTFETHATRWNKNQETTKEDVISVVYQAMLKLEAISFTLDHEFPLNRRFVLHFKNMMEAQGFVVAETLPYDNVTIFGKSQPDLTFYRGNGEYMHRKTVSSAAICTEAWSHCRI